MITASWMMYPLDKTAITNGRYSSALLFTRPQRISPCDHNPFTPSTMKQLDHEWTQMDADTRLMGMERKLEITLVKLYLYCMWLFYIIFATFSLMLMTLGGGLEPMFMCFHSRSLVENMMDIVKTTPVVLKILAMIFIHGFSYCKQSANRAAECTQWRRIPLWMWSLVAKASIRVLCFWHSRAIFLLITSYKDLQSMAMHVEVKFTLSHRSDFHTATVDCTTVDLQATSSRIKVK